MATTPVLLPGKSHERRSLIGYSPWGRKELDTTYRCIYVCVYMWGFPGGSVGKESAWYVGDLGCIPGLRRAPGEGNGYALQYSCLENSMDRGAWRATVRGVTKSQTMTE